MVGVERGNEWTAATRFGGFLDLFSRIYAFSFLALGSYLGVFKKPGNSDFAIWYGS